MALVRSFWHGGPLSPYEALCLTSFVQHGHAVELFTYDPGLAVPAGVTRRDAAEILPEDRVYFYRNGLGRGSVAGFTNLFRYLLLTREEGWWVDTDVLCLASDLPQGPAYFAWEGPDHGLVGNAILLLPPDDPLLRDMLAEKSDFNPENPWGTSGPVLLTKALRRAGRLGEAAEPRGAYPWHFAPAFAVFDPDRAEEVAAATQGASMQHLWNQMFRCGGLNPLLAPPEGSYLDRLCRRHGIVFPPGPRMRPDDLRRQARLTELAQTAEWAEAERVRMQQALEQERARAAALAAECAEWKAAEAEAQRMREALEAEQDALLARLQEAEAPIWHRWLRRQRSTSTIEN